MANSVFDDVIYIDTASANVVVYNGRVRIQAINFWAATTAAQLRLSGNDTSNVTVQLQPAAVNQSLSIHFPMGLDMDLIKAPTVTSGTAWVYYS